MHFKIKSKKYKKIFDINLLLKDHSNSLYKIKSICDDLNKLFFDYTFEDEMEKNNNEDLDSDLEEIDGENDFESDKDIE